MKKLLLSILFMLMVTNLAFAKVVEEYKVPVTLMHSYENKESMANKSMKQEAIVQVTCCSKTIINLYFKPMEMGGVKENINKVFLIDNENKVEAKKIQTSDSIYDTQVAILTSESKPSSLKLAFWVDAMDKLQGGKEGSGEQTAILKFDWNNAKKVEVEKTESSTTKTKPTMNKMSDGIKVFVNEKEVLFDAMPISKNGKILVPMKAIFVALDAKVTWDSSTKTATAIKGTREIKITIDKTEAIVKEGTETKIIKLEVPAIIESNRIYVPLRFIGEAFGNKVGYEKTSSGAVVTVK